MQETELSFQSKLFCVCAKVELVVSSGSGSVSSASWVQVLTVEMVAKEMFWDKKA